MIQQLVAPAALPAITRADFDYLLSHSDEPDWLKARRREAWDAYESMDFPDPSDEQWRRTDVRSLPLDGIAIAADGTVVEPRGLPEYAVARGIDFTSLAAAIYAGTREARERLYSSVGIDEWKYLALNAAMWEGGAFLHVPKDVELEVPVHIQQTATDGASFPRTLIVVGRNARVAIIEESHSGGAGRGFVSGAVEIFVGDGAKVQYYNINRWGDDVYNFNTVRAVLGRDAEFTALAAGIGSKLTKMRIDTLMPQPGARAELLGVTFGGGEQHFDYNTLQDHFGDHTISDLQFKSALTDSASLVWYGITHIRPKAAGSEANQTSRNMLLSDHAKAAPIPVLEIEAYDVTKCSHGATAGPVDENELFYLQTRGIDQQTAERMLVEGFFADVIDRVPDERVRGDVMGAILAKVGGAATERLDADELLASV